MPDSVRDDMSGVTAAFSRPRPPARPTPPEPDFGDYFTMLRRYRRVALGTFAAVLAASLLWSWLVDPVYRAEAQVLLRTEASDQLFPRTIGATSGALTRSPVAELQYVSSDAFAARASAAADSEVEVETRFDGDTDRDSSTLSFVAEAPGAETAAAIANSWADTYVEVRQALDVEDTDQLLTLLVVDRDAVLEQRRVLLEPVSALDEVIADQSDPVQLTQLVNQQLAVQRSLAGELNPLDDEARRLNQQISALEVDLRVLEDPGAVAVVSEQAMPPDTPVNGSLLRGLLVGLLAGLVLAALAVSAARFFFHRVSTIDDLRSATTVPVLGQVPSSGPGDEEFWLETMLRPNSAASEAYRRILTALNYQAVGGAPRRLLVVGIHDDSSVTAVAANLAALAGQDGTRVLLVGTDLRDSKVHVRFGVDNEVGVTQVLTGEASLTEVVHDVPLSTSMVSVLPAGTGGADPAKLLRSASASAIFDVGGYGLVIYVGAPILDYVDSLIVAQSVDGALLVVPAGTLTVKEVAAATDELVATGTRTPGIILTARRAAGRRRTGRADARAASQEVPPAEGATADRVSADVEKDPEPVDRA